MAKKKVVILGGGIAGLTAAWQMTKDPEWKDKFESVTLYQMGWRLGGKCATGRGVFGRIEEHGIHLFGGGYYNALRMMRDVYRDVFGSSGEEEFAYRFQNQRTSVSVEDDIKSATQFPKSPLNLDNIGRIANFGSWLADAIDTLRKLIEVPEPTPALRIFVRAGGVTILDLHGTTGLLDQTFASSLRDVKLLAEQLRTESPEVETTLARLASIAGPQIGDHSIDLHPLDIASRVIFTRLELTSVRRVDRWLAILNFIFALTKGYLFDIVLHRRSFAQLDNQDFAAWLRSHGVRAKTLELNIVQSPLRILYQFKDGDSSNPSARSMGAGAYFHWTLRTFAYMCTPFWFFRYGTGDTVISPLYESLRRRGVQFEFFRKVEALGLSSDGQRIESVRLRRQATTMSGGPYEPLEDGNWPAAPRYDKLVERDELVKLPHEELESYWSKYRQDEQMTLCADTHFDAVVFAISLGAIPFVCRELIAKQPDWAHMVANVKTVETQSLQVWFDRSSIELGINCNLTGTIPPDDTGLGAGLAKPFDGFSDFSDLISFEKWPSARSPKALWYFSDVIKTDPATPNLADSTYPGVKRNTVFANSKVFLERELGHLLSAFSGSQRGFQYDRLFLADPAHAGSDDERLAQQVIRANVQPSDRYVQALAGTTRYRLDAGRSTHFNNLYLAGDWTFNGLNVGCVEATVMSGMLASNDLLGRHHALELIGYQGR